jgi:hypothetical protein
MSLLLQANTETGVSMNDAPGIRVVGCPPASGALPKRMGLLLASTRLPP